MLYLKELNLEDAAEEYACLQEIPAENGFYNPCYGMDYEDFVATAIPRYFETSKGVGLKPGYVPDTWYLLWDDGKAVGLFKLRHYLNETLRNGGGHIGYGVRKGFRGRGYGTRGLAMMIEKARAVIPEDEIYMSVNKDNPASLKVMLNNGAYIHHEDEEEYFTRIKL